MNHWRWFNKRFGFHLEIVNNLEPLIYLNFYLRFRNKHVRLYALYFTRIIVQVAFSVIFDLRLPLVCVAWNKIFHSVVYTPVITSEKALEISKRKNMFSFLITYINLIYSKIQSNSRRRNMKKKSEINMHA